MKCFYHTDVDGKCSGAIVNKYYKDDDLVFIPIDYKDNFPFDKIEKNEQIIIVDFSLQKPGDFKKLLNITEDIVWIDHHKTAIEKHSDLDLNGVRDITKAGCELTWKFFYEDKKMPLAVEYAGRYDVWDFSKYGNKLNIFQTGIRLQENDPGAIIWESLLNNNFYTFEKIMEKGEIALKYRKHTWASQIKSWSFWAKFEGYKAICCNIGSVSSQLFDTVLEDYDLMIPFVFDGRKWTVSLYTKKDIDCSEIAKKYGGGGHKQAAGFQCDKLPFVKEII